jgi:hypothetical protein
MPQGLSERASQNKLLLSASTGNGQDDITLLKEFFQRRHSAFVATVKSSP